MASVLALVLLLQLGTEAFTDKKSAIWFVSWQHAGHIKALCPIAAEFQRRGREVKVVVHEEALKIVPSVLATLSAGPLPWSWDEELNYRRLLWDPTPGQAAQSAQQDDARKAELSEQYFAGSQRSLLLGLNATLYGLPRSEWPALLAIDVSSVGAMDLAEKLGLPFAVVSAWPVGPTLQSLAEPSALSHAWLPSELFAFTQSSHQQSFPDRLKRFVFTSALPWFMSFAGFHEPRRALRREFGLDGRLELLEAPQVPPDGGRPLVVILSHWGLDRPRPLPPTVQLVGPVDDYDALVAAQPGLSKPVHDWIHSAPEIEVVYISFGTNVRPRPQVLRILLATIAQMQGNQQLRFLWDAKEEEVEEQVAAAVQQEDSEAGQSHSQPLPGNLLFAPSVPQLAVLSSGRIAAFVTHCGLNSVHEALHFGVPMLGLPFVGDQLVTARLIVEAGAGLRLSVPSMGEESLREALERLSGVHTRDSFRFASKRAGRLGTLAGGARRAADALEAAAEHGVSHLRTIAELMPESTRLWDVQLALCSIFALFLLLLWASCGGLYTAQAGDIAAEETDASASSAVTAAANRRKKRA
eukprot:TRINITY_DN91903_c0_g1_i1.p1 TRINITY_DN91903_c0_g1~~TRINITY_DN91903_c0_g1_i1.p1  ORF type:complete len:582 (+),score=132.89 TRINITY_DN91903_c0_g1_i1:51-1796(+)